MKLEKKCDDDSSDASKRIAMISTHGYVTAQPPLGAPDTGGQVVFVLELSRTIGRYGYKVDIFTRQFEGQESVEEVDENIRIIRFPCGGDDFIPKEYLYENIHEWVEHALGYIHDSMISYDLINTHYWDAGLAGKLISQATGFPHVFTPHSLGSWKKRQMLEDYPDSAEEFERKYNFSVRIKNEKDLFKTSDKVLATTPVQEEIILNDYNADPDNIMILPPGYDDTEFFPVGQATREHIRRDLDFEGPMICALSRLANNKGLDLLIDAFALMNERHVEAGLNLAIGHDERNEQEEQAYQELLQKRADYGLEDKITFSGYIPPEKLADYYRAADLFVLSSRYEPFGMTAVEAMACGTPTVITPHGGLCRFIHDGVEALIADPFDVDELAMDMASILRHDGLSDVLSEQGSSMVRQNFAWTEIARQLIEILSDIEETRRADRTSA